MVSTMLSHTVKKNRIQTAWLTTVELASALRVSVKTIRRAYLNGEIPVERIFRVVRFDIEKFKEAMRRNGQGHSDVQSKKRVLQRAQQKRLRLVKP